MKKKHPLLNFRSVGPAALDDFLLLGVESPEQLAASDPDQLYERLCALRGVKVDICCLDVFRCAVAQARDPLLPAEQREWAWWSRKRLGRSQN